MKKTLVTFLTAFALSTLAACGGKASAAGVYELDKAAFKESLLANMPPEAKKEKVAMDGVDAMVSAMNVTVELKADGTATETVKGGMDGKDATETGTWKLDGNKLTVITKDAGGKEETKTADYSNGQFSFDMTEKGMKMKTTFKKK